MGILRSGECSCASDILNFLAPRNILPNIYGTNWASWNGNLDILKWLADLPQAVLPDIEGANMASENGHLDVLKWLEERDILPDNNGANRALASGRLDILKLLEYRLTINDALLQGLNPKFHYVVQ